MKQTLRIALFLVLMGLTALAVQPVRAQSAGTEAVATAEQPAAYRLSAAYPNPFNPRTSFSLTVQ